MSPSPSNPSARLSLSFEFRFWLLLLLVAVFYFIAANTGSGWIFLLCSMLLTAALAAVILPWWGLSRLRIRLRGAPTANAGQALTFSADLLAPTQLSWLALHLAVPGQSPFVVAETVCGESVIPLPCTAMQRGIHPLPPVIAESSYPFGLVWVRSKQSTNDTITIFPETVPTEGRFLLRLKSSMYVPGGSAAALGGFHSSSFRGVRDYVRGDSRRFIHWNLSARHGNLMVKEFDREGLAAFDLALNLNCRWENSAQFELAVVAIASLLKMGHAQGIHPSLYILAAPANDTTSLPHRYVTEEEQLLVLATLEFSRTPQEISYQAFADRSLPTVVVGAAGDNPDPPPQVVLMEVCSKPLTSEEVVWDAVARRIKIGDKNDIELL